VLQNEHSLFIMAVVFLAVNVICVCYLARLMLRGSVIGKQKYSVRSRACSSNPHNEHFAIHIDADGDSGNDAKKRKRSTRFSRVSFRSRDSNSTRSKKDFEADDCKLMSVGPSCFSDHEDESVDIDVEISRQPFYFYADDDDDKPSITITRASTPDVEQPIATTTSNEVEYYGPRPVNPDPVKRLSRRLQAVLDQPEREHARRESRRRSRLSTLSNHSTISCLVRELDSHPCSAVQSVYSGQSPQSLSRRSSTHVNGSSAVVMNVGLTQARPQKVTKPLHRSLQRSSQQVEMSCGAGSPLHPSSSAFRINSKSKKSLKKNNNLSAEADTVDVEVEARKLNNFPKKKLSKSTR